MRIRNVAGPPAGQSSKARGLALKTGEKLRRRVLRVRYDSGIPSGHHVLAQNTRTNCQIGAHEKSI
ncbi:hypothetical protein E0J16_06335 [Rhizobium pisi]|nr:hypothetical protein CHR56_38955 [Rhizobium leguminosarum bv. viciae]TBE73919.1 hypothetical protein ELG97_36440 [Rhizobium leguminosarum]TCA61207.1 hypothetical protein E0J16_06335 [Rhizobium pisi]TBY36386.1 hypothetical protein E0H60_22420 [Rhizobium leguminosarum bv. viciae]TBY73942.1 hypothetical protein E0H51_22280 [Rhizobium leguminosarum bv. viciae]